MPHANPSQLQQACAHVMAACACEGVRRSARTVTRHYERALAPSGVRATQLPILVALGAVGPVPITPLAERLALDRTTLTRNLKLLEERALVAMVEDDRDGRVRLPMLTDEGRRVLAEALEAWRQAQGEVEERFGRARLEALSEELTALAHVVDR